ncbi:hypothetical protein E2C01_098792 [Portunus trituberculatus]|uniref:Uncharacterized protein n=1 Tax=Portunus trituberculatus TaxID=210409 RepID=A0A5B7K9A5_PORTR|nr:hypothetical protein [Portunus trituberculatus]
MSSKYTSIAESVSS